MKKKLGYYDNQISPEIYQETYHLFKNLLSLNFAFKNKDKECLIEQVLGKLCRVVSMDVARTRMNILNPILSNKLQKLLTLYCKNKSIQYKQGMNQIMVPFLLFSNCNSQKIDQQEIYWMFDCFFNKYLLNLYFDDEFNSLEFLFRMISIILEYHDPGLARFLNTHDLTPQLYSTPWFMTLFANKLSLKMVYLFWSIYIIQNDEFLIFYFIVALLIYKKNQLLQVRQSQLPQYITQLIFQSQKDLLQVYRLALVIRKLTPKSLIIFCYQNGIFQKWSNFDKVKSVFEQIDKVDLFLVLPLQLVIHIYGYNKNDNRKQIKCLLMNKKCIDNEQECDFCKFDHALNTKITHAPSQNKFLQQVVTISNDIRKMDNIIHFIVVDIRLKKTKILIDCQIINIQDQLEEIEENFTSKYLEWRGTYHFVLLFSEFKFDDLSKCDTKEWEFCKKFIQILYSLGFLHLGILEGGFLTLENEIRQEINRCKDQDQISKSEIFKKSSFGNNVVNFFSIILQTQQKYYYSNNILSKIQLLASPSKIVSLQNLVRTSNGRFFIGKYNITLITKHLFVVFQNTQILRQIIVYLGNCKSATEYLIGVTKYNLQSSIVITSVLFLKYTTKVLVKAQPSHLAIHLQIPKPNIQYRLSSYLSNLKQSQDAIKYLSEIQDQDYYEIYRHNPNNQGLKLKIIFQSQDTKDLTQCADFIKKNFQSLENKYTAYVNKK